MTYAAKLAIALILAMWAGRSIATVIAYFTLTGGF